MSKPAKTQSLSDTLRIGQVDVFGKRIINQQNTATTRTEIDTMVMKSMTVLSLSELLSGHTPIFIKSYGRGSMASASFRGTAPSHTAVHWNGIQLNSPMLGMVDFSLLPVGFFDEITLKHGSSSLDQGEGALGGSIEMRSSANWDNRISGQFTASAASFSTYDFWGKLNLGTSRFQSKTRAFWSQSENNFSFKNPLNADIDPETGNYIHPTQKNENADWLNRGILQEMYFRINENQFLTARIWGQNTDRSIPTLATNESDSESLTNRQTDQSVRSVIQWDYYLNNLSIHANSGLNSTNLNYILKTRISGETNFQEYINSKSQSNSWFNALDLKYRFSNQFQMELKNETNRHQVNTFEQRSLTGYDQIRIENLFMLKALYQISDFGLNGLIRNSWVDRKWHPLIPMLGLEYSGWKHQGFTVFARAARNFRLPTLNDLYYQPGGNPNLRPEKGLSFDLGSGFSRQLEHAALQLKVNAFYSPITDWIVWLPTYYGGWEPQNVKKVISSGIEISSSIAGSINQLTYNIQANYALSNSINQGEATHWADQSIGKQLPYIPRHSANSLISLQYKRINLNYNWNYYSKRFTTTSNQTLNPLDELYAYFMNDVSLGREFHLGKNRVNADFKIFNLFNEKYRTVLQRMMPKCNYSLTISYTF